MINNLKNNDNNIIDFLGEIIAKPFYIYNCVLTLYLKILLKFK